MASNGGGPVYHENVSDTLDLKDNPAAPETKIVPKIRKNTEITLETNLTMEKTVLYFRSSKTSELIK